MIVAVPRAKSIPNKSFNSSDFAKTKRTPKTTINPNTAYKTILLSISKRLYWHSIFVISRFFTVEHRLFLHYTTKRKQPQLDKRVQQHFYKDLNSTTTEVNNNADDLDEDDIDLFFSKSKFEISQENIQKYITDNNNEVRLFNLKNLLFDLLRDRNKYDRAVLFDLLAKFRDCNVVIGVDMFSLEDEFFNILYDKELYDLLEEITESDSDRSFKQRYADWF